MPQTDDLSPRQKVAILMIALGQDTTAEILKYLNDIEIEGITQAIAELKTVTSFQEEDVLQEFEQLLATGSYIATGGIEFARGALERAVGPHRSQTILDRVNSTTTNGFYLLRNVPPNQLVPFISKEHPQTIALILSQLDPGQAAGIIGMLPDDIRSDVTYRIATLEQISPHVLRDIEQSLAHELQAVLTGQIEEIGGPKKVADILNMTGRSIERSVLDKLDAKDPEIAENIRNMMFTFDDVGNLADRDLQVVLREVDTKDLSVALKAAAPNVQERIFSNVSERMAQMIKEEMDFSGPLRLTDVEEVQLRIIQTIRQLEEAGQISVSKTQEVFI